MKRLGVVLGSAVLLAACANDWNDLYERCVAEGRCSDGGVSGGGTAGGSSTAGGAAGGTASAGGAATAGGSASAGGTASAGGSAGASARLVWEPAEADAGTVEVGASRPVTLRLRNVGDAPATAIDDVTSSTGASAFSVTNTCTGQALAPTAFCQATVTFAPLRVGVASTSVQAVVGMNAVATATVSGIGERGLVHLSVRSSGLGTVVVSPSGVAPQLCTGVCDFDFPRNTTVDFASTPGRSTFGGYTGCAGSGSACQTNLTLDAGHLVIATFTRWPILTVQLTPDASFAEYGFALDSGIPGLDCPGACALDVPPGTPFSLSGGSPFSRLICDAACMGTVTSDHTVLAQVGLYNRAFISPELVPTNLGGVGRYTAACGDWARDAGLPGSKWIAWMGGDGGADPRPANAVNTRGWVRVDGKPFVDQLYSNRMFYPPTIDNRGNDLTRDSTALTVAAGPPFTTGPFTNCGNWTQTSGDYSRGIASGNQWSFSPGFSAMCALPTRVLCLQNDWSTTLPAPGVPSGGKLAFLSRTALPASAMGASTLCIGEGAVLGRSFVPFRALAGSSAWSSLNVAAASVWYRPDGVQVATSSDLAQTSGVSFSAPVIQYNDGGYAPVDTTWVHTGAPATGAGGMLTSTCSGWSTGTGPLLQQNRANDAASGFTNGDFGDCLTPRQYYCFEN